MNSQLEMFSDNPGYDAFVEKFKPKKTTDDCYTPPLVYEAVKDWACETYGIDPDTILRPFYPGGDYEHAEYPPGCVVLRYIKIGRPAGSRKGCLWRRATGE